TESICNSPMRSTAAVRCRIVTAGGRGRSRPWAAIATRRACARLSVRVTAARLPEGPAPCRRRRSRVRLPAGTRCRYSAEWEGCELADGGDDERTEPGEPAHPGAPRLGLVEPLGRRHF